jgi:pimeloyl-ACP methyl ester carboxylesterase
MPQVQIGATRYAYTDAGEGPLLLFGHGLLASKAMFAAQIDALRDRYRCVSVDWPGHHESGFDPDGFTFYDLAEDVVGLVEALGADRAVLIGLSQGGMIFMRTALAHPEVVAGLALLDTSAGPEDAERLPQYEQLATVLRDGDEGPRAAAVEIASQILYGPTWREANPHDLAHEKGLILSHDREGIYLAARAVFDRDDVRGRLSEIEVPTVVLCGEDDSATPPEEAREICAGIRGAELTMIPGAGHHSAIESPAAVTAALESFLSSL